MIWRFAACAVLLVALVAAPACGDDDDDGDDVIEIDATVAGTPDAPASTPDSGGGTQGLGQFCNTLPEGGPYCTSGLDCCSESLTCREPDDCGGAPGFLPCTDGGDCPTSKLCCDTSSMRFCTKQSACDAYGGTVIP